MATIPIYNPVTPFLGRIPGGLRPSLMVRLKGKIHGSGRSEKSFWHWWFTHLMIHVFFTRCSIDFINSPALHINQDVAFHISIRPKDKVIVRNHFQNGNWAMEERYGECRVKKNDTFEIVILAEFQHYKIAVNGHHLGVFRHRLPLNMVQYINVSGEVTIDHILLEQDSRSAQDQAIISQVTSTPYVPINHPMHLQIHQQPPPPYQTYGQPSTTYFVQQPSVS